MTNSHICMYMLQMGPEKDGLFCQRPTTDDQEKPASKQQQFFFWLVYEILEEHVFEYRKHVHQSFALHG